MVHSALWAELRLPEPRLVPLLHALLGRHAAWFRLQRCADPFAELLGIRGIALPDGASEAEEPAASTGEDDDDELDTDSPPPPPPPRLRHTDEAILTVMEFLSVTRVDAIYLLSEHAGNIEAALASVLG